MTQPELVQDRSFRLVAESTEDGARVQQERDRARELIEEIERAQMALPIVGEKEEITEP